jgi:hypothetical protein
VQNFWVGQLRVTHPCATTQILLFESFDLHVLSTPPAFTLSQDQTLQKWYENSNLENHKDSGRNEKSLSLIARDKLKRPLLESEWGVTPRRVTVLFQARKGMEQNLCFTKEANPTRELGFQD